MKKQKIIERNFKKINKDEQDWIVENNYCDYCKKADTGIDFPVKYEYNGKIFIEGSCRICGSNCRTEINE